MKTKYNTITIGIPAYNEQVNLARLLMAIIKQKTTGVRRIESVIVFSDGSDDKTVSEAKSVVDKRIKVVVGSTRKGKNARLNEIFRKVTTDILVTLDSDIVLEGEYVIDSMAKAFKKVENPGLIAGNAQPLAAKTIFEEASNNFVESLNFIKNAIRKGQNIYSVRGPILAYAKSFLIQYSLPLDVPDDRYSYFLCKRLGYGFYFESTAKVYFRSPKTFTDQIKQCKRFRYDRIMLGNYIDQKELEDAYFVPMSLKVQAMFLQLFKNPMAYLAMKVIQIFDHISTEKVKTKTWDIAHSTKSFL